MSTKQASKKSKQTRGKSKPRAKRASSKAAEKAVIAPAPEVSEAIENAKPVRNIQKHADKEVRKAFPAICSGLIERAKSGAMGETKLLLRISRLDEKPTAEQKRRGKTLSAMLLAELKKEKDQPLRRKVSTELPQGQSGPVAD